MIDTLKGIFQLIGLIFSGIHTLIQPGEVSYYTELAGEMLENLSEKILQLNFTQIFQEFIKFGIKAFKKIKDLAKDLAFSIYEIAYFLGYLAGFVVETIISLLLTGGTLTVEQVLTETFVAPITNLLKGLKKTLSKAQNLLEKIYIFVKKLFDKLRHPKQAFRELFEVVEGVFKKSPEKLRAATLRKWAHVFDEYFYNHLSRDVAKEKITIFFHDIWYIVPKGEGGHFLNKYVKVKEILCPEGIRSINQLPGDVPFIAKINIVSEAGKRFPKRISSSMFPKNWTYERIREEVAFVYENTVAKEMV